MLWRPIMASETSALPSGVCRMKFDPRLVIADISCAVVGGGPETEAGDPGLAAGDHSLCI